MFDTPIRHAATKVPGERGYASEWNADHIITSDLLPRRSATIIVAASDSLDKGRADYVCDGVADQVEIQKALDDARYVKGTVLLLEGTYYISGPFTIHDYVTLTGVGHGTILNVNAPSISCIINYGVGITIRNIKIEIINVGDFLFYENDMDSCTFENNIFSGDYALFASYDVIRLIIRNNIIINNSDIAIYFGSMQRSIVEGNIYIGTHTFLYLDSGMDYSIFTNNIMYSGSSNLGITYNSVIWGNVGNITFEAQYISAYNQRIINVGSPISNYDAATKKYVDDSIAASQYTPVSYYYESHNADITVSTSASTVKQSDPLPAGKYLVCAGMNVDLYRSTDGVAGMYMWITQDDTEIYGSKRFVQDNVSANTEKAVSLESNTIVTITANQRIKIKAQLVSDAPETYAHHVSLSILKV